MANTKEETLYHALFLARHLSRGDLKDGLVYILYELEMPSHILGYHYVKNAILMFYRNPVGMLLQGIYEAVIETVNPSASYKQLEQDMRSAIGQAYRKCAPHVWRIYIRPGEGQKPRRPSNQEFISEIASFMELWQACCKEVSYEI